MEESSLTTYEINWHEISDLLLSKRKIEIDPEYPYWVRTPTCDYPFDISHFKKYEHTHIIEDTGMSVTELLEVYNICELLGE